MCKQHFTVVAAEVERVSATLYSLVVSNLRVGILQRVGE